MAALETGTLAPEFSLPTTEGKQFSLAAARQRGPVLLAFFKVGCPVCQFTFPYLERIHKAYGDGQLTVIGVSQNGQRETVSFMRDYGISFPVVLDDTSTYRVSNAYGLTNVPTVFLIASKGQIQLSSVGWVRKEVEDVNTQVAKTTAKIPPKIFHAGEDVPEFRAG